MLIGHILVKLFWSSCYLWLLVVHAFFFSDCHCWKGLIALFLGETYSRGLFTTCNWFCYAKVFSRPYKIIWRKVWEVFWQLYKIFWEKKNMCNEESYFSQLDSSCLKYLRTECHPCSLWFNILHCCFHLTSCAAASYDRWNSYVFLLLTGHKHAFKASSRTPPYSKAGCYHCHWSSRFVFCLLLSFICIWCDRVRIFIYLSSNSYCNAPLFDNWLFSAIIFSNAWYFLLRVITLQAH